MMTAKQQNEATIQAAIDAERELQAAVERLLEEHSHRDLLWVITADLEADAEYLEDGGDAGHHAAAKTLRVAAAKIDEAADDIDDVMEG